MEQQRLHLRLKNDCLCFRKIPFMEFICIKIVFFEETNSHHAGMNAIIWSVAASDRAALNCLF